MPRIGSRIPKLSNHRASKQSYVTHHGRRLYLGKTGLASTRKAYASFVAALLAGELDAAPAVKLPRERVEAAVTVAEVCLAFFKHACDYYRRDEVPTGESGNVRLFLRPLVESHGDLPVGEFGPRLFKAYRDSLVKAGRSRAYINRAVKITCRAWKWAASEELVTAENALALRTVGALRKGRTTAKELPPIGPVGDDVVERTLVEIASEDVRAMVAIQRLTGARPGEVVGMTTGGFDQSDPACWIYTPEHHKTEEHGKTRRIFIGPRAIEILSPLIKASEGRLFDYDRTSYTRAIARACRRAGVPLWAPNRLRHTFATHARRAHGLEAAQVMLGHSSADVTQVYAERDETLAREVASKLG